jgi:hypothetical protein
MRKSYDFSKSKRNPYAKRLKASVTIRLDPEVIEYFKQLTEDTSIPYQTLINLYLRDCAKSRRKLKPPRPAPAAILAAPPCRAGSAAKTWRS